MSEMKIIMENWKRFSSDKLLIEHYEAFLLNEYNELLEEGVLEILKKGVAAGKELYAKASKKVNDFVVTAIFKAIEIVQKTKKAIMPAIKLASNLWDKMQKFCAAHKMICFAIKMVVVALVLYSVSSYLGSNDAMAAVEHGGSPLSQDEYEAVRGFIHKYAEDKVSKGADAVDTHLLFGKAIKILDTAQQSSETFNLKDLEALDEGIKGVLQASTEIIRNMENTDPDLFAHYSDIGSKLQIF